VAIVTEKTKARQTAERMESERMAPMTTRNRAMRGAVTGPNMLEGPSEIYDAVRSVVSPRKGRSEEEMGELTREVGRAQEARKGKIDPTMSDEARKALVQAGYAKGGTASSRADGCAKRGKTRGKML
jgi:hypothetical protein